MFPQAFIDHLHRTMGSDKATKLLQSLEGEPSVSIRINPLKISNPLGQLDVPFASPSPFSFCRYGYLLNSRPNFSKDPFFFAGAYYVQEASSMAIEEVEQYLEGEKLKVLDLCAAPGGKSTHLLSLLSAHPDSFLVSNEVIRSRATVLVENITKWGVANSVVTCNDPADFKVLPSYFDLVLVDAPCSGEGMFRKDKRAVEEWSPTIVEFCASRQRRIVSDIWGSLREGGILLYSTCTFNNTEDEDNVQWIASTLGAEILSSKHLFPGISPGEGFFFAILRKTAGASATSSSRRGGNTPKLSRFKGEVPYIKEGYSNFMKGDLLKSYPEKICEDMLFAESNLHTIYSGVAVAKILNIDKKLLLPTADLALSEALRQDAFPQVEIGERAEAFILREPLSFHNEPKGYLLLKYKGIPIGFVKNLQTRANVIR